MKNKKILISACLVGVNCRYDGKNKLNKKIMDLLSEGEVIIICPEVLSGLPTPRPACNIVGGDGKDVLNGKAKVIGINGKDYTKEFIKGAKKALELVLENKVEIAYLRDKSPSCGYGRIYKENGDGYKIGNGIFAELLKQNGIKIVCLEEE